jgi:hypothetical protein
MAELLKDENPRKDLYRMLLADKTPGVADKIKKYSFNQFEKHLLSNEDAQNELGWYLKKKGVVSDPTDFSQRYIQESVAPPAPKPQAAPVAPAPVEEEQYAPEPQPAIGSPEYDAQLQAQYGGMKPTLGATFGGVPAAFETKAQKKQEQISPAFKAQQLAFEDVPIAEEQRRSQRQFAKATKQQQQAALMGGPGFEYEQEKKAKERGYGEWGEDVVGSWVEGGKRIGKNILSTVGYFAQTQAATDPMANLPYEKRQEMMQQASQTMYDNATAAQNTFQNEIAKRNIQTSVLQAINKGDYSRLPESVLYTVGDAAMQIIPSILTFGGSTYAQTLPQVYKDGVDAIAKEKGISPEQAIANGDDAFVVSQINAGVQSALEYAGAGLVSKGIASKGGYKAMRDWLLSQNVNRRLAQGAALLGVGTGEAATEYGQELTGQIGKTAAKSPTTKAFLDKLPNEIFTPEARNQRAEAFVGGLVGGLGLAGGGQAIQSAMDRTLFEAPKIGKATQRPDMDVVQTDNKIQERNKIAQAMEEAVKANPEAEGQIRQQYQKRINEAAPKDEEVLMAYESLALLPETEEKNTIRENLEAYMAEKGIQAEPTGMDAGLGELMRREPSVIQTVNAEFPAPVTEEEVTEEVPSEELIPLEEDEDLAAFGRELEAIEQAAPVAPAEEAPAISPLNIDFTKNEGRNVNYQGVEGRIKIDSDGAPYVFTKDGDVVYIEGGLSGQTPQQLGVQPLADDVINEADVETVLQDENAPLDQNQLEYDFDNNTVTLYGKPFTYEGVETNSKGQTTALRLRDANGKVKFVRNEDTILEFEIQKELYEKSRTNKPATIESATAAAQQLQVVPVARIEQVPEPIQQKGPVGDIEGDEVVAAAPAAPAPKGSKKAAPVKPTPAAPEKEEAPKPEPKKEEPKKEETPKPEAKEAKPTTGTPQEGTTVEIAPQREGGSPRKMVFKDGEWKQNVGGDMVKVGPSVQQQAQEAFAGKAEVKPAETKFKPNPNATYYISKGADEVFYTLREIAGDDLDVHVMNLSKDLADSKQKAKELIGEDVEFDEASLGRDYKKIRANKTGKGQKLAQRQEGEGARMNTLSFGKYNGKTIDEVFEIDKPYILYLNKEYSNNTVFQKGVRDNPKIKEFIEQSLSEKEQQRKNLESLTEIGGIKFDEKGVAKSVPIKGKIKYINNRMGPQGFYRVYIVDTEYGIPVEVSGDIAKYADGNLEQGTELSFTANVQKVGDKFKVIGRKSEYTKPAETKEGKKAEAKEEKVTPKLKDYKIKPPSDDVSEVAQSSGLTAGKKNTTKPISELSGGVDLKQEKERRRVDKLKEEITSEGGYISRLIVNKDGEVIEGQHRLEALRELGFTEVPVVELLGPDDYISDVIGLRKAIEDAGLKSVTSQNELVDNITEILVDEKGDVSQLEFYEAPKGYEKPWFAAVKFLTQQQQPSAPSFTSQQSSEAATAFDKAKTSKGFDKKYGKGAYKALSDITKNFDAIMDKVSDKIKQDCL